MAVSQLLFAGCYERFLLGYAPVADAVTESSSLVKKYTFAAHRSAVKCVASAGAYLVSGGADDSIHIYDLKTDIDLGFLINPGEGAVPTLALFTPPGAANPSHMLSGSADGSISIWSGAGSWEHLKLMKGHKGSINSLAVHPSGRLALSTSRDSAIRMWNLVKGRCTYTSKLDLEGDIVAFSPSGVRYSLVCGPKVSVHSAAGDGALLAGLTHARRVQCMAQPDEDTLLTGCEDGSVRLWDLRAGGRQQAVMERAHTSRVRGLCILRTDGDSSSLRSLASASSDGSIKVWDVRMLSSSVGNDGGATAATAAPAASPACVAEAHTGARITCLCLASPPAANAPNLGRAGQQPGKTVGAAVGAKAARAAVRQAAKITGSSRPAVNLAVGPAQIPHAEQFSQGQQEVQEQQQQQQERPTKRQKQLQKQPNAQGVQARMQQLHVENEEQPVEQPSRKQAKVQPATTQAAAAQPHKLPQQKQEQGQQQREGQQEQRPAKQAQQASAAVRVPQQPQMQLQQQTQQAKQPAVAAEKRKYSESQLKKQASRAAAYQAKKLKGCGSTASSCRHS